MIRDFAKIDPFFFSFIWHGSLYFFPTYIWGLKQANNNAQRLSVAVAAIHQAKGFFAQVSSFNETMCCHRKLDFKVYVDDFGGVESTEEKAKASFQEMKKLLKELGFEESWEKAEGENEPDE